jgi:hypothetical protein
VAPWDARPLAEWAVTVEIDGHRHEVLMTARDRDHIQQQLEAADYRRSLTCYETPDRATRELRVVWGKVAVWSLVDAWPVRTWGPET